MAMTEKRHFNVIDVVIILVLLALISFAANIITVDILSKENTDILYTLRITGVPAESAEALVPGDQLFTDAAGTVLGEVTAVTVEPARITLFDYDSDRFVSTVLPDKQTLYVTVSARCAVKDHMCFIGDTPIAANTSPQILLSFGFDRADILSVEFALPQNTDADSRERS